MMRADIMSCCYLFETGNNVDNPGQTM